MVAGDAGVRRLTAADPARAQAAVGSLRMNLHWSLAAAPQAPRQRPEFDVDLGALYQLSDGRCGVVQYLGGLRGAFDRAPFLHLDTDDRAGSAVGENLFLNLDRADSWQRVLVFVYAHHGPLARARIGVDFHPSAGAGSFRIGLDPIPADAHACAVALITSAGGQVTVRREARFVPGYQQDLDRVYGFGLRWGRADKPGLR